MSKLEEEKKTLEIMSLPLGFPRNRLAPLLC